MRLIDLTGKRFGSWTVVQIDRKGAGGTYWLCRCDCGSTSAILSDNLRGGKTRSCGCTKSAAIAQARTTHGMSHTPEHGVWAQMNGRCHTPTNESYANYGGRGIFVCDRWRGPSGFANFYADMGARPSEKHQLERIDNDGPYSPDNCKWATRIVQQNNTRKSVRIEHRGRTLTLSEWARESGIPYKALHARVQMYGWPMERALTEAPKGGRRRKG